VAKFIAKFVDVKERPAALPDELAAREHAGSGRIDEGPIQASSRVTLALDLRRCPTTRGARAPRWRC
jgi:hypothetical protein